MSHWSVCICSSHCDFTMHGRWKHYDVRDITTFGNVCHLATSINVRHIATLRCLVDCNFTMFDTLWCSDMCVTLQREEIFSILRRQGDVGHIETCIYVRHIGTCIYVCHIVATCLLKIIELYNKNDDFPLNFNSFILRLVSKASWACIDIYNNVKNMLFTCVMHKMH